GLVTRGYGAEMDEYGRMTEETRTHFANHILQHLETGVRYESKRYPIRHVIQMQARHLAGFLRGEVEAYAPYKAEWWDAPFTYVRHHERPHPHQSSHDLRGLRVGSHSVFSFLWHTEPQLTGRTDAVYCPSAGRRGRTSAVDSDCQ